MQRDGLAQQVIPFHDAAYHQWESLRVISSNTQHALPLRHSDIGSGAGQRPAIHGPKGPNGPRQEYPGVLRTPDRAVHHDQRGLDDQRHGCSNFHGFSRARPAAVLARPGPMRLPTLTKQSTKHDVIADAIVCEV